MDIQMPVKIGIMSFAHMHAYSYARCLKELPEVEFVGVADEDATRAEMVASDYGVKAFANYEDMLASDVQAVIVCSENANHRRHAVMAAQNEKHVLCEKPLSVTKHDAEAMIEVCKRSNVKLQTAFPCRFHSAFRRLRERVASGNIGRILGISATNQGVCPWGWFVDKKLAGGGAVLDHTVHVADLMRVLLGSEPLRIYAEIGNRMFGQDFDDTGLICIEFANGTYATIDCSWSRPKSSPFWGNVGLKVTGASGTAKMDMFAQKIEVISDTSERLTHEYWGDDADLMMIRSFVKCIANDVRPEVTGEDGAKALEVAIAAYESARLGKPVELPIPSHL